jgi:hypothetical protein
MLPMLADCAINGRTMPAHHAEAKTRQYFTAPILSEASRKTQSLPYPLRPENLFHDNNPFPVSPKDILIRSTPFLPESSSRPIKQRDVNR